MVIQLEKIWLFETDILDPYIWGTVDGVTTIMENERIIDYLKIDTVTYYIDVIAQGGLSYTKRYGGEDKGCLDYFGKSSNEFSLEFNLSTINETTVEKMIGKQFSVVAMKRDLSYIAIFGRFTADRIKVDNEVLQRVTFESDLANSPIYKVNSIQIDNVENELTVDNPSGVGFGFDYDFDLIFE